MKGRDGKGPPSADLLVCFPSRSRLTLMPKPICSPARPTEPNTRQRIGGCHPNHQLKKSTIKRGQASPLLWVKTKPMGSDTSEPTSPKVTCAGQVKVRPKPTSCKNWQSVMEEIERIHKNKKQKKRPNWVQALGFKKEVMQFLTCLRSIRFDFRCFGSFPQPSDVTSDDDEDDDEDVEDDENEENRQNHENIENDTDHENENESSKAVFSKWFMVLQENQTKTLIKEDIQEEDEEENDDENGDAASIPPPNALLLMRCRSAPAKSWLEEKEEEEEKKRENAMEEEEKNKSMVVMTYGSDFYKFSSDIAKETWVVGGIRDALSRSRSWKK